MNAEEYTLEARWSFMKKLIVSGLTGFILSFGTSMTIRHINAPPPPPVTYHVVKAAKIWDQSGVIFWYEKDGVIRRDHFKYDDYTAVESKDGEWYVTYRGKDITIHMPKAHFNEWLP